MVGLSDGGEFFAVKIFVAIKTEAVFTKEFFSDMFGLKFLAFGDEFTGDFVKTLKIATIIIGRIKGATFFNFKVFKEVFNEVSDVHIYIVAFLWYN